MAGAHRTPVNETGAGTAIPSVCNFGEDIDCPLIRIIAAVGKTFSEGLRKAFGKGFEKGLPEARAQSESKNGNNDSIPLSVCCTEYAVVRTEIGVLECVPITAGCTSPMGELYQLRHKAAKTKQ